MTTALHAEWTKLRTVAGPGWLLAATVILTVALSAATTAAMTCTAADCAIDAVRTSLAGVQLGQAVVAVLAVLVVGGEYSTGLIHTTLTAIPRRLTLLAAKATIVAGTVLVAGGLAIGGCIATGGIILPRRGFTPAHGYPELSIVDSATLRAAAGSVLYLALIALLSLGIATLVRDSAAAIGTVLGLLYLFPILATVVTDERWQRRIEQLAPSNAGLNIQATQHLADLPIGPWAGLGVLAAWAAAALLSGGLALRWRDA